MKLDKRFDVLPFCCFSAETCEKYIGQKGYFTNNIDFFKNIDFCLYGTLEEVHNDQADSFQMDDRKFFRYFIPECLVKSKEKQYRPYTLEEFCDKFHFGYGIILRPKDLRSMELHVVYNGYKVLTASNKTEFYLGPALFTLSELLEGYERFENGRWVPFGVEVEE